MNKPSVRNARAFPLEAMYGTFASEVINPETVIVRNVRSDRSYRSLRLEAVHISVLDACSTPVAVKDLLATNPAFSWGDVVSLVKQGFLALDNPRPRIT
jgi:hypothetical protein